MDFIEMVKQEQKLQMEKLQWHRNLLESLRGDTAVLQYGMRRDGKRNYYIINQNGQRTYANKSMMPRVNRLKLREYLKREIEWLERNQCLFTQLIKKYKKVSYAAVNRQLPRAYQGAFVPAGPEAAGHISWPPFTPSENPFHREDLIHHTSFGLAVRTKSEMVIAEMLYSMGIPFVYEKEVFVEEEDGNLKAVYPDFSVPLGGEWFYIEHLGRLDLEGYRQRNAEKLQNYHASGILMPGQLIFTMDGPGGVLDAGPVCEFLERVILPRIRRDGAGKVC